MKKSFKRIAVVGIAASLSAISVFASLASDCYCNMTSPLDVKVDNWQTFSPKVTMMHSLNAYLANELGQTVYYIPKLEELPQARERMFDCTDYAGTRKQFAAIYDGFFDVECYDALVRKSDGTYANTPKSQQSKYSDLARELETLGWDFLLTSESMSDVKVTGESISAKYNADLLNVAGTVDYNTAVMDIYKAIGQEKYDMTYVFAPDADMKIETSPLQNEIHLSLAKDKPIDTSDAKGYVFATRTVPSMYWRQAALDGIVADADVDSSGDAKSKTTEVTLAEFCNLAYTIMNIYGEPVYTQREKSILLQAYGTVVPYQTCTDDEVSAIEAFVAKGIISPDDDSSYMNWQSPIDPRYMMTMLMRIKDTGARMTYKDIQITMDASMLDADYYSAKLNVDQSAIKSIDQKDSYMRVTEYRDLFIPKSQMESMINSIDSDGKTTGELYVAAHLKVKAADGTLYPAMVNVTTQQNMVVSDTYAGKVGVISSAEFEEGGQAEYGQLMQFCISEGVTDGEWQLRIPVFNIPALATSDGTYQLVLVDDKNNESNPMTVSIDGSYSSRSKSRGSTVSNHNEVEDTEEGEDDWENEEEIDTATTDSVPCNLELSDKGQESSIIVKAAGTSSETMTLAQIMADTNPSHTYEGLTFYKVGDTSYEVQGASSKSEIRERVTNRNKSDGVTLDAYCKRDKELMVSTEWLLKSGFVSIEPRVEGEVMMLTTDYTNVFIDREHGTILVGSVVYDVSNTSKNELWFDSGTDKFVNFRALLGWTGDFLVFKSESADSISVSVTSLPNGDDNPFSKGSSKYAVNIKMMDYGGGTISSTMLNREDGVSINIQGNLSTEKSKDKIYMSSLYPFANYFVYMSNADDASNLVDIDQSRISEYRDWLFVFKPKTVVVNGKTMTRTDTQRSASIDHLVRMVGNIDLDDSLDVWAYPLFRTEDTTNKSYSMPSGMGWSDKYGYYYQPESGDISKLIEQYFNADYSLGGSKFDDQSSAHGVLPFYMDNGTIRCYNLNTAYYTDTNGETKHMDYGTLPAEYVLSYATSSMYKKLMYTIIPEGSSRSPRLVKTTEELTDAKLQPAVVSPALWFMNLNAVSLDTVLSHGTTGCELYYGTAKMTVRSGSKRVLKVGSMDVTDALQDREFMRLRETTSGTSSASVTTWYSASALNSFDLSGKNSSEDSAIQLTEPSTSKGTVSTDVIDWDEFTLERILEDFEFGVAIAMIIVLFIIPRFALFTFLLLLCLGVIQNLKPVQWFCDRVFDPYKFLTAGRRDVHTFRSGTAFRNSLIAMAIFSLFMDGTIIHIYEWIFEFFAYLFGVK